MNGSSNPFVFIGVHSWFNQFSVEATGLAAPKAFGAAIR
jgi:hypothetical protein